MGSIAEAGTLKINTGIIGSASIDTSSEQTPRILDPDKGKLPAPKGLAGLIFSRISSFIDNRDEAIMEAYKIAGIVTSPLPDIDPSKIPPIRTPEVKQIEIFTVSDKQLKESSDMPTLKPIPVFFPV